MHTPLSEEMALMYDSLREQALNRMLDRIRRMIVVAGGSNFSDREMRAMTLHDFFERFYSNGITLEPRYTEEYLRVLSVREARESNMPDDPRDTHPELPRATRSLDMFPVLGHDLTGKRCANDPSPGRTLSLGFASPGYYGMCGPGPVLTG